MHTAIVTDSTADIPADLVEAHHIHVIPNYVVIDGQSYEDGRGMSREKFYHRLPNMNPMPTTASSSPGVYQELYDCLFEQGAENIISIHAAGSLTSIFNTVALGARGYDPQGHGPRVHVIDSGQLSLGLGFQVLAAAEKIASGAGVEEVLSHVQDVRSRVRVVAMLDSLEYVRRSGRVSWAKASIGTLLQLRPFIELKDGQVHRLGEAISRKKGIKRLLDMLKELGDLEWLAVLHTNAEADALQFIHDAQINAAHPTLMVNVTTVIGTHVGPNGLGFAAVKA